MLFRVRTKNSQRTRRRAPAFALLALLILLSPLYAGKIPCKWSGVKKIVAVADIHGAYENFVKILKGTGLIDEDLNWIGERTHLVQLGDILDRGSGAKDTFDLLMKLEKQAEEAGGMVHVLIGNHEEVNIVGIALQTSGYVTKEQFLDFLPEKYKEEKETAIRKKYATAGNADGVLEALDKFWKKELNDAGSPSKLTVSSKKYQKYFFNNYGKWLLTKNLAIKINDIIFVHGGFADVDVFLDMDLQKLNNEARSEFTAYAQYVIFDDTERMRNRSSQPTFLTQPLAPHWYRGWVRGPDDDDTSIKRVLTRLNANHMVVGHTVRDVEYIETRNLNRFERQVWAIDVGISRFYNDQLFALIIEKTEQGSKFSPWWGEDEKK